MLIPFTAKWNANNACIAFCEGNGSIDSWAIIKNEAALSGIKILATVTKNWLTGAWVLAYLNTNNSGFRRISRSARHASQALAAINLANIFLGFPVYQPIALSRVKAKWIHGASLRVRRDSKNERKEKHVYQYVIQVTDCMCIFFIKMKWYMWQANKYRDAINAFKHFYDSCVISKNV